MNLKGQMFHISILLHLTALGILLLFAGLIYSYHLLYDHHVFAALLTCEKRVSLQPLMI